MRSTQFIGHTKETYNFLSHCTKLEKIDEARGMFGEHIEDLHLWKDSSGKIWEEFIQSEPWSSGPMIFLGLRNKDEVKGWTDDQINNMLI